MVFCNTASSNDTKVPAHRHNPYFNRWFSAIDEMKRIEQEKSEVTILILIDGFLQYNNI